MPRGILCTMSQLERETLAHNARKVFSVPMCGLFVCGFDHHAHELLGT